jgi:hypothetical protein
MKFNIPNDEIKDILEMHSKMKKNSSVISEQTTVNTASAEDPNLTKLRDAIKAGCLINGALKRSKSTNQVFYRKPSVQNPSLQVDFFGDMTYKFVDGSKSGKWKCDEIATNATKASEDVKKSNVVLTKRQDLINKYTKNGAYKLKDDLSLDEIGSWEQFTLNFPDGSGSVILYKNPSSVSTVEFTGTTTEKQGALISGENRSKVCREKIKDFADSANKKLKLPMSQINADKTFVMACRDQFGMKYNDLGVTKKNLEYLTGQRDGLDGYKLKVGSPYRL